MPRILKQYTNSEGVLVTVYKPRAPRATEKTWKAIKGSIFNMGAKAAMLHGMGYRVHPRG